MEDEAPVENEGRIAKSRQFLSAVGLRVIDAISGFLSSVRAKIEPAPSDADRLGDSRKRRHPDHSDDAVPQSPAPQKPRRLIRVLILVLVLVTGAIIGAAFSYQLLSKTLHSDSATIDNLRDELAEMKKQASLDRKQIAKHQQMIHDYDNVVAGYLKEIEDSRTQMEELRRHASTVDTAPQNQASQGVPASPSAAATPRRAMPQKTGTCTMDSAKGAANLANCIEQFNRK